MKLVIMNGLKMIYHYEVLKSSIQNCADNKFQEEVQQENDTIEDMEM